MVPIESITQPNPARNPAVAPQAALVLESFRNIARFAAMINANKNEKPKMTAVFPRLRSSFVNPHALIHAFPKRIGEYHRPPRTNVDTAAAIIANQFKCEMGMKPSSVLE
jgi:hypothetical protein